MHQNACILIIIVQENVKTAHRKSWPANLVVVKNFGLILKNKIAAIVDLLKYCS